MLQTAPTVREFFWDDLLEFIEERRVIPVVGAELLTVPNPAEEGKETALLTLLAHKLGERLRVPTDDFTGDDALHLTVCRYLQAGGRREEIYPRLRTLLKELAPPVPRALRQLARIRHFNLYVTTTFDSLLSEALDDERFGGAAKTATLAYAPNHHQDLPPETRHVDAPKRHENELTLLDCRKLCREAAQICPS
jgi:hypothetical protein